LVLIVDLDIERDCLLEDKQQKQTPEQFEEEVERLWDQERSR
jgi:hypothetical protein